MRVKDIPGYEGLYGCDVEGNVYSLVTDQSRRKGILKPYRNTAGYLRVNLFRDKKVKHEYVHRLVARTYLPNPEGLPHVNHLDVNPGNNAVANLEWCTAKENIGYSRGLGNQHKDRPVLAVSEETMEVRRYLNIRTAATDIFGKWYALNYKHKREGEVFSLGGWRFRILEKGGDPA